MIRMEIDDAIGHMAISSESGTPKVVLCIIENSQMCPLLFRRNGLSRASLWCWTPTSWVSNIMVWWEEEPKAWILMQLFPPPTVVDRCLNPSYLSSSPSWIKCDSNVDFHLGKTRWVTLRRKTMHLLPFLFITCFIPNSEAILETEVSEVALKIVVQLVSSMCPAVKGRWLWVFEARTLSKEVKNQKNLWLFVKPHTFEQYTGHSHACHMSWSHWKTCQHRY